jgi:hypothetical protein
LCIVVFAIPADAFNFRSPGFIPTNPMTF